LEDRELNQARSKPDTVDRPVKTARTFMHHYNSIQYCSTETDLLIYDPTIIKGSSSGDMDPPRVISEKAG